MGLGPINVDLPGALQPLPEARGFTSRRMNPGLGLHRRRRKRRTGIARRLALAARERSTTSPGSSTATSSASTARCAATARSSRNSRRLPRRRLECHQGHLGPRLGCPASPRQDGCCNAHGRMRRRRFPEVLVEPGSYIRKHFFGKYPELAQSWSTTSPTSSSPAGRGGHDPLKVYAAYKAATEQGATHRHPRQDGQGLRPRRSGRRPQHLAPAEEDEREGTARVPRAVRHPDLRRGNRRAAVLPPPGGQPRDQVRRNAAKPSAVPPQAAPNAGPLPMCRSWRSSAPSSQGLRHREASTTMAVVDCSSACSAKEDRQAHRPDHPRRGPHVRHGALFREFGIYSSKGQLYEPVDRKSLLYYHEAKDGQILEEGITEAGSMASFIAAGTAHATHGVTTIPFYIYYSMFGFQRVGDSRSGSRRQPRQGLPARRHRRPHHPQRRRSPASGRPQPPRRQHRPEPRWPTTRLRLRDRGDRRRRPATACTEGEDLFYYLTLYNENYHQPAMPEGVAKASSRASTSSRPARPASRSKPTSSAAARSSAPPSKPRSSSRRYGVSADVWSATSYKLLRNDALQCRRHNMLHPEEPPEAPTSRRPRPRERARSSPSPTT
jgi:pyruvate dehydrogenase E1 component